MSLFHSIELLHIDKDRLSAENFTTPTAFDYYMLKAIIKKSIEFWDQKVFRSPFIVILISLCFSFYFIINEKYSLWIRILPFLVLCVLILIFIIYFLCQEASSREYVNLSQFLSRTAALPLRKYVTFIALVIAPFFVVIYAIDKYYEIKETQ